MTYFFRWVRTFGRDDVLCLLAASVEMTRVMSLKKVLKMVLSRGKRNGRAARLALSRFIAYLHFQNTKWRLTNRHFGDAQ